MNLNIRYWFPNKSDAWLTQKEKELLQLKIDLEGLGITDTDPFIGITVSALIREEEPKDLDYRSDHKRKRLAKLNNLKKAIDALGFELRWPLKKMYGIEFPHIVPDAVEAYMDDQEGVMDFV